MDCLRTFLSNKPLVRRSMAAQVDVFLAVVLAGVSAILASVAYGAWKRLRTRRSGALLAGFFAMMLKGLVLLGLLLSVDAYVPILTYVLALDCAVVLLLYAGVAAREVRSDGESAGA